MNQDKLEFYYQSKNLHSIQEKTASDKQQELEEKIAGNMRAVLSNFALKHPKATESAITGGILGAGSELVMPANKNMYGNPSTNLGEIGKRALLGATLGGIGGELKTQVRSHVIPKIAQEDFDKIAGKLDALKSFGKRNAFTIGTSLAGGAGGAFSGYYPDRDSTTNKKFTKEERKSNALKGGILGTVAGSLAGGHFDRKLNAAKPKASLMDELLSNHPGYKKAPKPAQGATTATEKKLTPLSRFRELLVGGKEMSNPYSSGSMRPGNDLSQLTNPFTQASKIEALKSLGARGAVGTGIIGANVAVNSDRFKQAGFIGRAGELLAGGAKMPVNFGAGAKMVRPGNISWGAKVQRAGFNPIGAEALKSYGARGVAGAGLLGAGVLGAKAMSPNNNVQQPLPPPIKTAFALAPSSLLQGAGSLMAKSPRVGGAVIGGAAGLAGNALSGEDHALGSTLAGAAMGGLAGKKLLANNATRNPLFGKSFGTGVRNELKAGINAKQNLANSLKVPTKVNMSATEQAAANLKAPTPMNSQMTPRNVPINTNKVEPYAVNTKGPVAKLPTQQSEQLINEKAKSNMNQQVSQAYKPTRSSVPMPSNVAMGSRPQHVMNLRS